MSKVKLSAYGREVEIESDEPHTAVLIAALKTWFTMGTDPPSDTPDVPAFGITAERASSPPASSTARRIYGPVK